MPFKERSLMDQRFEFCRLALTSGANLRELCRRWRPSPGTACKWPGRYRAEGLAGLRDRSRRPLSSPERTCEATEEAVLAVREANPAWGAARSARCWRRMASPIGRQPRRSPRSCAATTSWMAPGPARSGNGRVSNAPRPTATIAAIETMRPLSRAFT